MGMKTTTALTLDIEVAVEAKERFGNLSGFVNDFLKERLSVPREDDNLDEVELNKKLNVKSAEIAELKKNIKKLSKGKGKEEGSRFIREI